MRRWEKAWLEWAAYEIPDPTKNSVSPQWRNAEPRRVEAADRMTLVMALRDRVGMTYREIGERLGVSMERARQLDRKGRRLTWQTRQARGGDYLSWQFRGRKRESPAGEAGLSVGVEGY